MDSKDILQQLEVKNREIYLNKLAIDLENNRDILLMTFNNVTNLLEEEMLQKMQEIMDTDELDRQLSQSIKRFYELIMNKITKLVEERYINIKNCISNIDNIDYNQKINDEREKFVNSIKVYYKSKIAKFIINFHYQDNDRMSCYLQEINYNRLMKKVEETFLNTDTILHNNYLESKNKFHELNAKTLK